MSTKRSDLHLDYHYQANVSGEKGWYSNVFVWAIQLLDPRHPSMLICHRTIDQALMA